jgi:DNA-binding MarR family transcriptional regulator
MTSKNHRSALDLAVEVRFFLTIVGKLSYRDLEQRVNQAVPGMSLLQYGVMRVLSMEQATLSEISAKMMLTPSTLVPVVDKLERDEFVLRGKDPNDRRRTPLLLTEKAYDLLNAVPPGHPDDAIVRAVTHMGSSKAMQMRELLHELLTHVSPDRELVKEMLANHPDRCTPMSQSHLRQPNRNKSDRHAPVIDKSRA